MQSYFGHFSIFWLQNFRILVVVHCTHDYVGGDFELSPPKNLADKFGNSPNKFQDFPTVIFLRTKIENWVKLKIPIVGNRIHSQVYLENFNQSIND